MLFYGFDSDLGSEMLNIYILSNYITNNKNNIIKI